MKNNFKKIFLTVIGILFLSFFVPQFAQADAFGVLDIFGMQLDALDFLDSGVNQFIDFLRYRGIGFRLGNANAC